MCTYMCWCEFICVPMHVKVRDQHQVFSSEKVFYWVQGLADFDEGSVRIPSLRETKETSTSPSKVPVTNRHSIQPKFSFGNH